MALAWVGSLAAYGQTHPTNVPERGFALVQSRQDVDSLGPLKGRGIRAIPFEVGAPLYPIKKHGPARQPASNAVYIQDNTTLRLYIFPAGLPQSISVGTFERALPVPKGRPIAVAEPRDLLLDVDFVEAFFTTMKPSRSVSRTATYAALTIGGKPALLTTWHIDYHDGEKFHYQRHNEPYDIPAIKQKKPGTKPSDNASESTLVLARKAQAYPVIELNGKPVSNGELKKQKPAEAATDFQVLNPASPLRIDAVGLLDLEGSDPDPAENEPCNTVSYRYKGRYRLMHFRYLRRELGYVATPDATCANAYRQSIGIPDRAEAINYRAATPKTIADIVGQIVILNDGPNDGTVVGGPKGGN
jgi:hypothetical protein